MKVKNLRTRAIVINGITINSGQTAIISDDVNVETLISQGHISVEQMKFKEKKKGGV